MNKSERRRPRGFTQFIYRLPIWLYRLGLGGLLGRRFLLINHVGRKSGRLYQTVVEVAGYDAATGSYLVASGYGTQADWYRNLRGEPEVTIQVGSRQLTVTADLLSPEASGEAMVAYARRHPVAARSLARSLGLNLDGSEAGYRRAGREMIPFVAFHPQPQPEQASLTAGLPGAEHHYVATNGITLHVVQAGPQGGPVVLLLHGFPEFWYGWRHQIAALAAAGYRVWAPDQRGYNLSEKPRGVHQYSLDLLAADVAGLIRQTGQDKVFLAGHDWGAAVAWWVALRYPHLLRKLLILNVPHPEATRRFVLQSTEQRLRSWYIAFFQLPWLPEFLLSRNRARAIAEAMKRTSGPGSFTPADLREYRRAALRPGALTGMLDWYRAAIWTYTKGLVHPRIAVPTRIIWGVHDVALSRELAPLSLEMCDDGDLVYLEQATHWLHHDEAERVSQLMLDFLEGV